MFRKISASEVSRVVPGGGGGEGTNLVNVNIKATEENDPVHLTSRKLAWFLHGGGTPLLGLDRYVSLNRVWFRIWNLTT